MSDFNFKRWLETDAYARAKEVIAQEVNSLKTPIPCSPIRLANPGRIHQTDYSVFKNTDEQKGEKYTAKRKHREILKSHYGVGYKKHLNIPSGKLEKPIVLQF